MVIKSLELSNFRNYSLLNLSFDRGTNILYGDNAQGKTNILEAIYLCATTKSHKGAKDKDIVNFNEEEAHIRAYLEKKEDEIRIDMHLRKNKSKGIAIDGTRIKKAAELPAIGKTPLPRTSRGQRLCAALGQLYHSSLGFSSPF